MSTVSSISLEGVERFVRVSDEWKAHLRLLLVRHGPSLSAVDGTGVLLRNLVDREVRHVNVRAQSRFERGTDAAQLLPNDSAEEGVVLDLRCAAELAAIASDTVLCVAEEANPELA